MKKKKNQKENSDSIFLEFVFGLLSLFGGTVDSKAGYSIVLSILGFGFLILPIEGEIEKPAAFYVIGTLLLIWAAYLLVLRIIEIKRNKNQQH